MNTQRDGERRKEFERSDISKALVGFVSTFAVAVSTKLVSMFFASQPVADVLGYLSENYSFWVSAVSASVSAAIFALKWTHGEKDK